MVDDAADVLTAALRKFGWVPTTGAPGRYDVWRTADERSDELLVPVDPQRGDYSALVERARREILSRYGRQAETVLSLLQISRDAGLEETEWKKDSPVRGMIAWDAGEALYASAREQLAASAKSTRERRAYHGNSSSYIAQRFISDSFMGQTDVGSFIISAYTPSNQRFYLTKHSEDIAAASPRKAEVVSGSSILDTFESSISAVREGLDEYRRAPNVTLFLGAVEDGLSYELAKALGNFIRAGDAGIKITRRITDSASTRVKELSFDASEAPVLDQVATTLAQDRTAARATIVGEVTDLSRKVKDGVRDRVIRLDVKQGGTGSSIRIRLNAEQYDQAMAVHRAEKWLLVSGLVEREGNYRWIYHPDRLELRDPPAANEDDEPLSLD